MRVENVRDPETHVQGVLDRVKPQYLRRHYFGESSRGVELASEEGWASADDFMTQIAVSCGRLLKGGKLFLLLLNFVADRFVLRIVKLIFFNKTINYKLKSLCLCVKMCCFFSKTTKLYFKDSYIKL